LVNNPEFKKLIGYEPYIVGKERLPLKIHNHRPARLAKVWIVDGKVHRVNGPAIEEQDGTKKWIVNDKLHRTGGPAIEYPDGFKEWWQNGKFIKVDYPKLDLLNKYFRWLTGNEEDFAPGQTYNYLTRWYESGDIDSEIAFKKGVVDDNIPDYQADADDVYTYIDRIIRRTFSNNAEKINKIAPGLTYKECDKFLEKWIEYYPYL